MEIASSTLSSAISLGLDVDLKFLASVGSKVLGWVDLKMSSAWNYIKKIGQGGKALIESIRQGSFFKIFKSWVKEDPGAAAAGVAAAGLAAATVLIIGGTAVAWIGSGIGALVSRIGLLGSVGATASIGAIIAPLFNTAETIYSMDWQITDEAIMGQINAAITAMYGPFGEFLGRSIATVAAGTVARAPRTQVNINRLALASLIHPDSANDLQISAAQLAYTGLITARRIAAMYALMKGRQAIKRLWKKLPESIRTQLPGLNAAVTTWGEKGKEPWSLESEVEERIEAIDDPKLQLMAEGFLDGFWDQFRESVEYVYS
ncbi:MAG: hypothetical protein ACRC8A_12640 [Microcoleaceae cyanobacterium]